jgi:hypothetical protein
MKGFSVTQTFSQFYFTAFVQYSILMQSRGKGMQGNALSPYSKHCTVALIYFL